MTVCRAASIWFLSCSTDADNVEPWPLICSALKYSVADRKAPAGCCASRSQWETWISPSPSTFFLTPSFLCVCMQRVCLLLLKGLHAGALIDFADKFLVCTCVVHTLLLHTESWQRLSAFLTEPVSSSQQTSDSNKAPANTKLILIHDTSTAV